MSKNPQKDFGPIADDYAFFESHATEAQQDAQAYLQRIREIVPADGPLTMLDFGCGSGTFTRRFLKLADWQPERLRLALVEPVEAVRRQAVARLAGFTTAPVTQSARLPDTSGTRYEIVLANHVFYYVSDLEELLGRLIGALSIGGIFVTAIAARTNTLIDLWATAFRLLDRDVPYNTSEDLEAALGNLSANYHKEQVPYDLTFPDTEENRMHIIRFLLADYLGSLPLRALLEWFDPYRRAGRIQIRTGSDHFTIRPPPSARRG